MQNQSLNEEAVFQIARRIQQPEALAAYLEQACGGDPPLHARVLALLGQTGDADQFLEAPPSIYQFEAAATMDQTLIEKPGTLIGLTLLSWGGLALGAEGVTIAFRPSTYIVFSAITVSVGIGVIAGILPAAQTARVAIVSTLRDS